MKFNRTALYSAAIAAIRSLARLNVSGAVLGWPNAPRTYSLEVQYTWL